MNSRWSEDDAASCVARYGVKWGEDLALRTYSSRLLGADPDLVLHGGGNTSLKTSRPDITGENRRVLCVKASGRDLSTIEPAGHPKLDLARLNRLRDLDDLSDAQMTDELRLALVDDPSAAASIETLVHAFLPEIFVDHTHAGAVLALTNQVGGEAIAREALGEEVIVLTYIVPGFALAKASADAYASAPRARGMVWMHHGLLSWGSSARDSYESTIDLVTRAERYIAKRTAGRAAVSVPGHPQGAVMEERLARVAPIVRGLLSPSTGDPDRPKAPVVLAALTDGEVTNILDAAGAKELALSPPLTTDHLIRTKPLPLWIEQPDYQDESRLRGQLSAAVEDYASAYSAYLDRHAGAMPAGTARFDPLPRVVLLPGLGAICSGRSFAEARIARDITRHTLRAKARIAAMGRVSGLSESDLFHMEYRPQQLAKLRDPSGASGRAHVLPLAGRVALVTGAAGAIGSGICRTLLETGALVAATDLGGAALDELVAELSATFGDSVLGAPLDVASGGSVRSGFERAIREWGGIDLLVINAGVAHVSTLADLDIEALRRLERVNVEGTLLLLAEAGRLFGRQAIGGDIVLISSKNVFAPGAGFGAYSATKAAAHQLARIASLEMASLGVRVNMVAPDAVFSDGSRRSGLWAEVGPARMRARGLDAEGLEEYYRGRNLLKARITAKHVARAVLFFATRQAPITGVTLPVDGGLPEATPR